MIIFGSKNAELSWMEKNLGDSQLEFKSISQVNYLKVMVENWPHLFFLFFKNKQI